MSHVHVWKVSSIESVNCGREPEDCIDRINVTTFMDFNPKYIHGCERPINYKRCDCGMLLT